MSGIKIDQLQSIIVNSIEEVIEDNEEVLQGNVKAAGNKAVRLLKERSRKKKRHGGSYAKGWSADVKSEATGMTCVVHNRQYQLTHLLENGHVIKNQYGSYPGRVEGDHVIEGVYKEVAAEFSKGGAMNSLKDLAELLDAFGLPWANGGFRDDDELLAPPYIDIEAGYGEALCADNAGWCRWMPYDVALYVRERDYELEKRFEAALDAAEFNYVKTVTSLDGDELIETAYEVGVTE